MVVFGAGGGMVWFDLCLIDGRLELFILGSFGLGELFGG